MAEGGPVPSTLAKRPSAADEEEDGTDRKTIIKRRLVRARKLRRPDDGSPDAGGEPEGGNLGGSLAIKGAVASSADTTEEAGAATKGKSDSLEGNDPAAAPEAEQSPRRPSASPSRAPQSPPSRNSPHESPRSSPSRAPSRGLPRSSFAPPRGAHPPLGGCRSVYNYTRLNHIEEGTYGVVFRARCNDTGGVFALKKLKLDEERHGFPITSLREIQALMSAGEHEHVVGIREVVVGDTLNQIFIVMPFVEHDLKTLLADMPHSFLQSEVKTIMKQLLSAVAHCHSHWILHRDLKTSNLLMSNRGQIKVADFGLARTFGDPLGEMTQLVVTLWYRAPELLLGAREYSTAVDLWSVGCIFAELMQREPLFPGRGELDQLSKIFALLGRPSEDAWPGLARLPNAKTINTSAGPAFSSLRTKFKYLSSEGHALMAALLTYDPARRITAADAGHHAYFAEPPLPKHPDLFPSFPSVASGERRHKLLASPKAPGHVEQGTDDPMDLESFVV